MAASLEYGFSWPPAPYGFSCAPLLTQRSGIVGTKCVHDTMGQEVDAKHLSFLPGLGPRRANLADQ